MCGIFGAYNTNNKNPIKEEMVEQSIQTMRHRGPEVQLVKMVNDDTALSHARLAIIDLQAASNQPFSYKHLHLTFNGEIFNYIEIRKELEEAGYSFATASDTEVLIIAYHHWGHDCVKRFNGMWAFVIYDEKDDSLFCSRDRFGIKPFNYTVTNGRFLFTSEIKGILAFEPKLREPNYNAIANYCRESIGAQEEETWFKNILRLKPAHNLVINRKGIVQCKSYWSYPTKSDLNLSETEALTQYKKLFEDSVKIRMRSDVPIGATLSSGLDSSSIVSYVNKNYNNTINCYTASFPNFKGDEFPTAKRFADTLDVNLHQIVPDYEEYVKKLSRLIYHLESGHSSPAIFPLYYITKKAKEDIIVFLEGQGADELLAGYVDKTFLDYFLDNLLKLKFARAFKELRAHLKHKSIIHSFILFLRNNGSPFLRSLMRKVYGVENIYGKHLSKYRSFNFKNKASFDSRLNQKLAEQHQTGLVNLLHYGDAISMMHSLENRLPFMDYRLVEFGFRLPLTFKIKNGLGKHIQRQAVQDILPDYILNNPNKQGFPSPLKSLFIDTQKGERTALEILRSDSLKSRELFDPTALEQLIQKHQNGKRDHSRLLYRVLSVELWFRKFIDVQHAITKIKREESINLSR